MKTANPPAIPVASNNVLRLSISGKLSLNENLGSRFFELSSLRPPISHMSVPIRGIMPRENKVISHPIMVVRGTAIRTPAETPSARPASLMPFSKGSSLGLNHSIIIALVVGIDIATPIPNTSLKITKNTKESVSGVNKWWISISIRDCCWCSTRS